MFLLRIYLYTLLPHPFSQAFFNDSLFIQNPLWSSQSIGLTLLFHQKISLGTGFALILVMIPKPWDMRGLSDCYKP